MIDNRPHINESNELQRHHRATVEAMLAAIDAHDSLSANHSRRVAAYSLKLGEQLQLDDSRLMALERGALLHDIGKIGVPDCLLLKRGRLDDDERAVVRAHVEFGLEIVDALSFIDDARAVLEQHHERFDGKGYPQGLRGEAIDLLARIVAVADAFDAMTGESPFRKSMSYHEALDELVAESNAQFDPKVVVAFLKIPESAWPVVAANALGASESADSNLIYRDSSPPSPTVDDRDGLADGPTNGWPGYPFL